MRKIVFPIHVKLVAFTLALLGASLGAYVYYAIGLFKSDKIAYVFESVSSQNEQGLQSVQVKLDKAFSALAILEKAANSTLLTRELFQQNPMLIGYLEFEEEVLERAVFIRKLEGLDVAKFREFLRASAEGESGVKRVVFDQQAFLLFWQQGRLGLWDADYFVDAFPESKLYSYHLAAGGELIHGNETEGLTAEVLEKNSLQQAFVFEGKKKLIVAMDAASHGVVFTSADYDKALAASLELRDKSLFFGLFTAGLAILLALVFGRIFTLPIKRLFEASQSFAEGEFGHRVQTRSRDELGALADAFNGMADDIGHYMGEMREKTRLENELKTAQLVQESFFPSDLVSGNRLNLSAYYQPASECGGDWWGYLETEKAEVVILADVTGHGTAAALVTALLHNSLTALKALSVQDPELPRSPARIMNYLNESLLAGHPDFFATAFALSFDKESGAASYCNASHNPPYVAPAKEGLSKQDFVPLMEELGPRLGESQDAVFNDVALDAKKGDKIILYTDGILELENDQAKTYGSRRFIKKLIELSMDDPRHVAGEVARDALGFASPRVPKDDITLVCLELK